ncbi:glycosyltransferase [Andreprevotia chitinilytica]|uniref:glycosyltransferase n=1 Tax=Andreprevotia chitinilytica TaxID=396808 RepID=UPI000A0711E4|nr:glycosyltransferase [Andreprevotia chitinilytica]
MKGVTISVVIPTYNRAELLRYTLESLRQQTLDKTQFEVIVVDDGGSDNSEAVVKEFADDLNVKYFWQEDDGFRAGKARNIGTAIAVGKYIVYIDTGVLMATYALEEHLRIHQSAAYPTVIIGYVYGFEIDNEMVDKIIDVIDYRDADATINYLHEHKALDIRQRQYDELGENITNWPAPFDILWTCHVSAEREELLKAGLFDEAFNSWGGEDVDLGVRLYLNKNLFTMERTACSFHWPHKKEVADHKESSANAAERIHNKYNLWVTSFYGKDLRDEKYSLNKVIKIFRELEAQSAPKWPPKGKINHRLAERVN